MRVYLNKVKNYCDLLGAAGYRVVQDDQIMHILAGLGIGYHLVRVVISARAEACTIQEACSILLNFEFVLETTDNNPINSYGSLPSVILPSP